MRATSFLSGLFLISVVLAAPTRKTDITDADPFHVGKRFEAPEVPEVPGAGAITQKLKDATETFKLPTRDLPVTLPASDITKSAGGVTNGLNAGDLTSKVGGATSNLPVKVPSTPPSGLGDLESDLSPLLDPVVEAVTPLISAVTDLLNSVLDILSSSDSKVKVMLANTQSNTNSIVNTLQIDLSNALTQIQATSPALQGETSGPTTEVTGLVSQVQVTATTLIADLQSLVDSVPEVSSLITTVKSIVSAVQATGL